jgi:hypothetical protein
MLFVFLSMQLGLYLDSFNRSSCGFLGEQRISNTFNKIKTVALSLVGPFSHFLGWLFPRCNLIFLAIWNQLVVWFRFRFILVFGFLNMDSKLIIFTEFLSLRDAAVHSLFLNNTLKNKTVVHDLTSFDLFGSVIPLLF